VQSLQRRREVDGGALDRAGDRLRRRLLEIIAIASVRKRFLHVSMRTSLIQVTLRGIVIAAVGVLLGHA
jgi:hypothetical protein